MAAPPENMKNNTGGVRRTLFLRSFLLTFIVGCSSVVAFAEGERSLARFAGGESALEGLVDFPEGDDDLTLVLHCRTSVSERGSPRYTFCLEHDRALNKLMESVDEAVGKSRLIPAIVDGKGVKVHIHYRVLFVRRGTSTSVHVYENWGHDVAALGPAYRAPQLWFGKGTNYKCFRHNRPLIAQATVPVSDEGQPTAEASVEFAEGTKPSGACEEQLKEHFRAGEFIPAEADGEPVEAIYTMLVGWLRLAQAN